MSHFASIKLEKKNRDTKKRRKILIDVDVLAYGLWAYAEYKSEAFEEKNDINLASYDCLFAIFAVSLKWMQ